MKTLRSFTFALLAGALTSLSLGASPVLAQDRGGVDASVADASILESAVTGHERSADRTRERLAELLAHDEVRALADARGVDLQRVEERAATLSDEELLAMESMVTETSAALDLSRTITISVTTVIIILLLLILVT